MEVAAGYQKTEIGVIPDDWRVTPLSECAIRITDGEHLTPIRAASGYYLLSARNVLNGRLDLSDVDYVGEAEYKRIRQRCNPEPGDVLISCSGTVGRVATVPEGFECVMVRSAALVKPKPAILSGSFIQYFLQSTAGQRQILASLNQGAQANLFQNHIQAIRISFPPTKDEQQAIATSLSDADVLIESDERLLAKKRDLKKGAMQELLTGNKRLPGFSGDWVRQSLRDCLLASPDYGINAPGVPASGSLPMYLRITDIDDDGRLIPQNRVAVNHPLAMNYLLRENEIVLARTGASVGKTYLYNSKDGEQVFAGFLIRARINSDKLSPGFFAAFTKTSRYWNWVRVMSMRSGQPGINGNEFAGLELSLPPTLQEQSAIAAIMSDMDAEIVALEARLDKARQLKQGMMQELLTGRIRLV